MNKTWHARNKRDLIIEVWEYLDCESVGSRELREIQQALRERFGDGAWESPASIARIVADEGAVLRHPEVFEYDLKWRERNLANNIPGGELKFASISDALDSFARLEKLHTNADEGRLNQLRATVVRARQDSQLIARSKILEEGEREQAKEIHQWLTVWLQSPQLFSDWLELRRRSPEFRKKFPS
jgi:hypothetical protein